MKSRFHLERCKIDLKIPATVGLSIRSSLRKPVRVSFTFFAVGISMLLFGAMLFMMSSMEDSLLGGIEESSLGTFRLLLQLMARPR